MFKIPTYEELEKKESELDNDRLAYSGTHLLKRKKTSEDDTAHSEQSGQAKKNSPPQPPQSPQTNDEIDDDDELLNIFIKENKDIIEKPLSQSKSLTQQHDSNKPIDFAVPAVPAPIKFDPKMPINRSDAQTSASTRNVAGSSYGGGPLIVSSKQRGNPVLKHIKNVPWKFCDQITPDYQMSRLMCGFFLSMKYHLLNATYIHKRLKEIGRAYNIRWKF